MHANSELREFPAGRYSGFECGAGREQSGAGDDAVLVGGEDAAIDALGHAEIVRVNDEPVHASDNRATDFVALGSGTEGTLRLGDRLCAQLGSRLGRTLEPGAEDAVPPHKSAGDGERYRDEP